MSFSQQGIGQIQSLTRSGLLHIGATRHPQNLDMGNDVKPRDPVVRRGATWYYRRRIPQDLLEEYKPKNEILISLRTSDVEEANRLAAIRTLAHDQEFGHKLAMRAAPECELSSEEIRRLVALWGVEQLRLDDLHRAEGYKQFGLHHVREEYALLLSGWRDAYEDGNIAPGAHTARKFLKSHGIKLREDSDSFPALALALLAEEIRTMSIVLQRFDGNPIPTPTAEPVVFRGPAAAHSSATLTDMLDYWKRRKKRPARTTQEAESAVREFERINGALPAASYVKAHAVGARYGEGPSLATLEKAIRAVRYDGLDLSLVVWRAPA